MSRPNYGVADSTLEGPILKAADDRLCDILLFDCLIKLSTKYIHLKSITILKILIKNQSRI